ncbi:hypothetical protein AALO_G00255540, partial [Alosa alosa]
MKSVSVRERERERVREGERGGGRRRTGKKEGEKDRKGGESPAITESQSRYPALPYTGSVQTSRLLSFAGPQLREERTVSRLCCEEEGSWNHRILICVIPRSVPVATAIRPSGDMLSSDDES